MRIALPAAQLWSTEPAFRCKREVNRFGFTSLDTLWIVGDLELQAELQPMDMKVTLAALAATAGMALFAGWRGARPPDFRKGPRMVPWRPLMVAFATAFLILLVHLVNLLGMKTGQTIP